VTVPRTGQILPPLDFLAEFTQHIPAKGAHLIRYYGWYSNKSRGMWKKAAEAAGTAEEVENSSASVGEEQASSSCSHQSWAMLIKRVYEADPLTCPQCGGQMVMVTFIEPPQAECDREDLAPLWVAALLGSQNATGQCGLRTHGGCRSIGPRAP